MLGLTYVLLSLYNVQSIFFLCFNFVTYIFILKVFEVARGIGV